MSAIRLETMSRLIRSLPGPLSWPTDFRGCGNVGDVPHLLLTRARPRTHIGGNIPYIPQHSPPAWACAARQQERGG